MKKDVTPEISAFFSAMGKKGGNTIKKKYGSEYFKRIASMRKTFGKQKKTPENNTSVSSQESL